MKTQNRTPYLTRETILQLLSNEEMARVSNAETAAHLADGDEYVDLGTPDYGVREAVSDLPLRMGYVLPRKAVEEKTWGAILALLATHRADGAPAAPASSR